MVAGERGGGAGDLARFKSAFVHAAHGYRGVSGTVLLNAAGDRAYGSYDFCRSVPAARRSRSGGCETFTYLASGVGHGRIAKRQACPAG